MFHLMEARPDLMWLHAGAAARDGRAVLILGPGGSGKSTLVTHLCEFAGEFIRKSGPGQDIDYVAAWVQYRF